MRKIALLLHNIRSAHNVGSIFRSADAAGVSRVYLSGYTPAPKDRFKRVQKDIAKTALGAETSVAWEHRSTPTAIIEKLSAEGWKIVGIEQDPHSINYRNFKPRGPTLFIMGNEVRGLSKELRSHCDRLVEIPMHGAKESLNVSVAAGIILFHVRGPSR